MSVMGIFRQLLTALDGSDAEALRGKARLLFNLVAVVEGAFPFPPATC